MSVEFYWVAVALVTIISAARITRLAVYDKFPPIKWVREKYEDATDGSGWQLLAMCGFCMSFWTTSAVVIWGLYAGVYDRYPVESRSSAAWWIVNGIFAASYLAATYIANDGDTSGDED